MEGALITDTLVSPSFPSLPVLHEPMWARWSTRERHNHAELTGHTSSDSKRNECTPANADELVSTAVDAAAGLLNTALRLLRVRRDTSIGLISYSAQRLNRGQLKRTQANGSGVAAIGQKRDGEVSDAA